MNINNRYLVVFLAAIGLLVASYLFKAFILILCLLLLIINRDLVARVIRHLKKTYRKNKLMALGLGFLFLLAATPFMVFLFIRTAVNVIQISSELPNSDQTLNPDDSRLKLDQLLRIKNKLDS